MGEPPGSRVGFGSKIRGRKAFLWQAAWPKILEPENFHRGVAQCRVWKLRRMRKAPVEDPGAGVKGPQNEESVCGSSGLG